MRITESQLRRLIRKIIKENNPLIIEALPKGFQEVEEPIALKPIVTNVKEFCSPSMLIDYNVLKNMYEKDKTKWVGQLTDQIDLHDFIAALYLAEYKRIEIPNFKAEIVKDSYDGSKAIQVSVLGPISEAFFQVVKEIEKEADADMNMYPGEGIVKVPTVNNAFKFSAEDSKKIINSTTPVMN